MTDEDFQQKDRNLAQAQAYGAAERAYYGAAREALRAIADDVLLPSATGEYHVQQGLRAAVHSREDIIILTRTQLDVLKRLDRNRNLLVVAIALLFLLLLR